MPEQYAGATHEKGFDRQQSSETLGDSSLLATPREAGLDSLGDAIGPLLNRVARHDQAAFAELYRVTCGKLFNTALLILRQDELAEQILQTSYIQIWNNAANFDTSLDSPIDWMIAIVRKVAITRVRHNGPTSCKDSTRLSLPPNVVMHPDLTNAQINECLEIFSRNELKPDGRLMIAAAYLNGESREQLADRFGIPVDAVKAVLRTALLQIHASPRSEEPSAQR